MSEIQQRQNRRKVLQGIVLSDKMSKTRVVQVQRTTKHLRYSKVVRMTAKYKAHDEENKSKQGDVVRMMETRPISREKRWLILDVVQKT